MQAQHAHQPRFTVGDVIITRIALPVGIPRGAQGMIIGAAQRDGSYPVVFDLGPTVHHCPEVWIERPGPVAVVQPTAVLDVTGAEEFRRDLVIWLQQKMAASLRDERVSGGVLRTRHGAQADAYRFAIDFWRRVVINERHLPSITEAPIALGGQTDV